MKFMIIVPANEDSEAGRLPSEDLLEKMTHFNEQMVKAGVMLAGEGLQPSSKGSRLTFTSSGKPDVKDGPFTESKELIAGFWLIQTKTKDEAIAWMSRAPFEAGTTLEIREVHGPDAFAEVDPTGKLMAKEEELRKQVQKQHS